MHLNHLNPDLGFDRSAEAYSATGFNPRARTGRDLSPTSLASCPVHPHVHGDDDRAGDTPHLVARFTPSW